MITAVIILLVVLSVGLIIFRFLGDIRQGFESFKRLKEEKKKTRQQQDFLTLIYHDPRSTPAMMVKLLSAAALFFIVQAIGGKIVFSFMAAIAGFIIPGKIAKKSFTDRQSLFEEQMIDCFGILTNSLRAGASLFQALEVTVRESDPPFSTEFGEVLGEVRLGNPVDKALIKLTERMPSKDLHMAVLAMNVTREYGGNLGEILMRVVAVMRERRKIQGKIEAITAQGKLSGWIVTLVPFFLLLVLRFMEPEMFGLMFTTILGNIMLSVAILMVSLGNFFIQKIVTIEI
ncbi:MAG: type II secretion system F family protein [Elusimicrobiota bacterium]|nr:type II secretion system F family protein [Elusimicrobiota bacterium]